MIFYLLLNLQTSHLRIALQIFDRLEILVSPSKRFRFSSSMRRNANKIGGKGLAKSATPLSYRDSVSITLAMGKLEKYCMYLYSS